MSPLVSVVIIFLNGERFLEEAVASVLAQSFQDWELLLVDDGSSDQSTEMAQRFAREGGGRIRVVEHASHANRGMSASRNLGARATTGKYIAFLDADDVWLEEKLEQQVAIAEREPEAAVIYGRTLIWHSWSAADSGNAGDHFVELGVRPGKLVPPPELFLLLLENRCQTPTTCNALIRRRAYDAVGGFEESFRGLYEDQAFFAKLHLRFASFVAGDCWAKYRQHPDSCSARSARAEPYHPVRLAFLEWLGRYMEREEVSDARCRAALRRHIWFCRHPRLHDVAARLTGAATAAARAFGHNDPRASSSSEVDRRRAPSGRAQVRPR